MLNGGPRHLASALAVLSILAQTPTIPERVVAGDGTPIQLLVRGDTRGLSLSELASASLVVRGRLKRVGSYLSADSRHIWTTYELLPSRVIVNRRVIMSSSVVTLYGGHVLISGTRAEVVDTSRRPFGDSTELLLFLVPADAVGTMGLRPIGGASGMFEIIEGQRLKSLRSHAPDKQEIDGLTFDDALPLVAQASRR
jgi:hypothetical protein